MTIKKNYTETDFFICDCGSLEHNLVFQMSDYTEDMTPEQLAEWPIEERQMMTVHVNLHQYRGFFKRLWVAIKYLFNYKCRYGHFDCIILEPQDAQHMIERLQKYLSLVERWKQEAKDEKN